MVKSHIDVRAMVYRGDDDRNDENVFFLFDPPALLSRERMQRRTSQILMRHHCWMMTVQNRLIINSNSVDSLTTPDCRAMHMRNVQVRIH